MTFGLVSAVVTFAHTAWKDICKAHVMGDEVAFMIVLSRWI